MNNMGQTPIDWLVEQLTEVERKNWINNKILSIGKNTLAKVTFDEIVQQAKEMEKQQMLTIAHVFRDPEFKHSAVENYYNENYG
jgi:hypothetical protein